MNINLVQNDANKMYSNKSYQTDKQDAVSNEYRIKIAKKQEELKSITKEDKRSMEEKQDMQRELRQQIQELNRQLRNHKMELQKEEKKNKEFVEQSKIEQQKNNLVEDNRLNTKREEATKDIKPKEDNKQSERENQRLGTIKGLIVAENSKEIVAKQSKTHVKLKGEGKVLESEINIDKQRGTVNKTKEERLENIELRIGKVSTSIQKQLTDTINTDTKNKKQENIKINSKYKK